jgi:hypothetical protein
MATGYNRVYNTVLSGNEAQSSLSGNDVRMLEFDAALKRRPAVVLAAGNNALSVEDWMQASIDTLLLNNTVAGDVSLGTDSATQAAAYVSLFDLRSTNEQRLLRVANSAVNNVSLKNTSATAVNVQVKLSSGAAADTQTLYVAAAAPGAACAGNKAGLERIVVVSASNLNSGAEVVQFNVLAGSL